MQDASSSFAKAADKLKDGRLSVVGAANKLIKLGAKASAKKVIPEENEPLRGVTGRRKRLPGSKGKRACNFHEWVIFRVLLSF